jgi:hypothetical protein
MAGTLVQFMAAFLAICVGVYFAFPRIAKSHNVVHEPLPAPTAIPYIGHIIGMTRRKFNYYVDLR